MAKKAVKQPTAKGLQSMETPGGKPPSNSRWQIESPTRGVYVGTTYAERARNWPTFERSPSEDRIVRFDDREAAEAGLVWVQSRAANARVREVD